MSDTVTVEMGLKGRIVVPWAIRAHRGWTQGTRLIAVETDDGVVIQDRDSALAAVRASLRDTPSLADELVAERHVEAARDTA